MNAIPQIAKCMKYQQQNSVNMYTRNGTAYVQVSPSDFYTETARLEFKDDNGNRWSMILFGIKERE